MEHQTLAPEERGPRFSISIETTLLTDRLKLLQQGDLVTYAALNQIIGQDVQGDARHILQSARHICHREYQIVTDAVRNIGIRRLTDLELAHSGARVFSGVRRAAKRGIERITAVADFDALPESEKLRHNASLSALALIRTVTRPKAVDRIMGAVNTTNTGQLPIGKTLELFRLKAV